MCQTPFYQTSNEPRHCISNIERTRKCSSSGNRTRTPYFWFRTIEHRTSNIVRPITKNHYLTFKSNVMKIHPTCWHWLIYFFILLENWILKLIQLLYSLYVLNRLLLQLCLQVYVSTLNSRLWIYFANSGMVIWETDFIILKYATRATFLSKCMANCWDAKWGRKIQFFFSESLKFYDFFLKKKSWKHCSCVGVKSTTSREQIPRYKVNKHTILQWFKVTSKLKLL